MQFLLLAVVALCVNLLSIPHAHGGFAEKLPLAGQESAVRSPRFAAAFSHRSSARKYKADEILVKFRAGAPEGRKKSLHKKHGTAKLKEFPHLRLEHLQLQKGVQVEEALKLYQADPDVEYAEPDYLYSALAMPDDLRFGELWGLNNSGQTGGTAGADIKAPAAWDITTGSSAVVVAIIDTGIDTGHADLVANLWTNPAESPGNSLDDDANGYSDDLHGINTITGSGSPMDDHGHGTHVAGTIGATGNNSLGVVGVNWNVRLIGCKFLDNSGSGATSDAVECLTYIKALKDRGVNIVATNNSWGGGDYSQALYDAINAQRDILFIAAAGNDSSDNDVVPSYPANYNLPNVIAVAATDHNDTVASFSNSGRRSVHVAAPGAAIVSTLPGQNYWGISGGYGTLSGTSMATPHVTGLAALLKAQNPGRDWRDIRNTILAGGDPLLPLAAATTTGRRISALGSLSCAARPLLVPLQYPDVFPLASGVTTTLTALSINCGAASAPLTATTSDGEVVTLRDDGVLPDLAAGDGIFTASWAPQQTVPPRSIDYLTFASPAGSAVVPPLTMTRYLPEANTNLIYDQRIAVSDGLPPYVWSLDSGSLPAGLSLDGATGRITGAPLATGSALFSVKVVDSLGRSSTNGYDFSVTDDLVEESRALTFSDRKRDVPRHVSLDDAGNLYVAGVSFNGTDDDFLTVKYDPAGNLLWSRVYDSGRDDWVEGVAADHDGNLYVVGGYPYFGASDFILVKYDAAGNQLWAKTYDYGKIEYPTGIAIDALNNIYVTGYDYVISSAVYDVLTLKLDSSGAVQWAKTYDSAQLDRGFAVSVDGSGNVYVAGDRAYDASVNEMVYQFLTLKYAPNGTLLWAQTYGGIGAQGVAVDAGGAVYVGGDGSVPLLKYDASGTLLWGTSFSVEGQYPSVRIMDVKTDGSGFVRVAGYYWDNVDRYRYFVGKLDAAGALLWTKAIPGDVQTLKVSQAIGSDDTVYVSRNYRNLFLTSVYREPFLPPSGPLTITTAALTGGVTGTPCIRTLTASGGVPPYTWTLAAGTLPAGLSLNPSRGFVAGVPTTAGTFPLTFRVTDAVAATTTHPLSITVHESPTVTTASLAGGFVTTPYSQSLTVSGGLSPYVWSVAEGSLPAGLVLNSVTGVITGTPTVAGSYPVTFMVTDSVAATATKSLSITINEQMTITTVSLAGGVVGTPYSQTLTVAGGVPPYAWSVTGGLGLPPGLTLNNSSGLISGTPTAGFGNTVTLKVTDSNGLTASRETVWIKILGISTSSLPSATKGAAYSQIVFGGSGELPYSWSVSSGSLPPGLSLVPSVNNTYMCPVSGTATRGGTYTFSLQIRDNTGLTYARSYSLTVTGTPTTTAAPPGGNYESAQTVTLSTDLPATIYYTLDGSAPTTASPVYAAPLSIAAPTTVRYFARDGAGRQETANSATYTILPAAVLIGTPSSPTNATGATFTVGGARVTAYMYKLDGGSYSAETPVATPLSINGLAEGTHTLAVLGRDSTGLWQLTPTTADWSVDLTPPVALISGLPASPTLTTGATLTVGGADVVVYRYRLDTGAYSGETPVAAVIGLSSLAEGVHEVAVLGRDSAGNWQPTPTAVSWSVEIPVTVPGSGVFTKIQEAYNALLSDNVLQLKGGSFTENLLFDRNISITLRGGYDRASDSYPGFTVLSGRLEISAGTVTVENLLLQ